MFDSVRKQKNIRYIYIIIIALYIWTIFIPFLPLNKSDNIKYLIIAGVVGPGEYLDENGDAKKASKIFTVSPFFQFTINPQGFFQWQILFSLKNATIMTEPLRIFQIPYQP